MAFSMESTNGLSLGCLFAIPCRCTCLLTRTTYPLRQILHFVQNDKRGYQLLEIGGFGGAGEGDNVADVVHAGAELDCPFES